MKKIVSLLLAMCMLLSLGACGKAAQSTASQAPETEEASASQPVPTEAPAAPASETETVSASEESVVDSVEEGPQLLEPLSYPVSDGSTTLTYWYAYPPFVPNFLDDVSDKSIYRAIDEASGVNIQVVGYSLINASEQFQLMIASGDYTDIIYSFGNNYSGSVEGAVEDEIIMDLGPMLDEYAPDYKNYLLEDEEVNLAAHTDAGYVPSFCGINDNARLSLIHI